jgi:hypothetical protein
MKVEAKCRINFLLIGRIFLKLLKYFSLQNRSNFFQLMLEANKFKALGYRDIKYNILLILGFQACFCLGFAYLD